MRTIYRLVEEVKNPTPDRRHRRDFAQVVTFPKGLLIDIIPENERQLEILYAVDGPEGQLFGGMNSRHPAFPLIKKHLVRADDLEGYLTGADVTDRDVLEGLVRLGIVVPSDIRRVIQTLENEDKR